MIAASTAIKWRIIMKLVSFAASERNSYGAVVGDGVFDLGRRLGDRYPALRAAIAGDALGAAAAEVKSGAPDIALSQVTLLPPITDPDKIICAGRNYRAHAAEAGGVARRRECRLRPSRPGRRRTQRRGNWIRIIL
jgi:2-keto-4-pentenoate hydratase/2-oxohepta-3-ene-1,7-dioic acid hydratase in catechol pathway